MGDIGPFWLLLGQNCGLGTPLHSQLGRSLSQDIYIVTIYSNLFHAIPTVLDQQSAQSKSSVLFGPFWAPLAKIWDTSRKDTPPIVSKPQPGCPVTRSIPFHPFGTTRVLKVRFWPFLDHFGPFWALRCQNLGHPRTDTLPTGSKLQPGGPVTCSTPFQPFWITRVLQQQR